MSSTTLLTGGVGYVGIHTFIDLREAGFEPLILDNFASSSAVVLERVDVIKTCWAEAVLRRN